MEIHNIESFLSYRRNVRGRTMRVIEAAPADKLEWRHADGAFSAGDLARHIAATERYTFAENVLGRPSRYSGCGRELADGRDHVIAFMCRMHEETTAILERLQPADLERKCGAPEGSPITTWKLLRAMIEHEVHHRGEIYVCLALLGVPRPPLFGLTSEELIARGVGAQG
ncbi:MAG: DinB family protein [Bryobacteraceae bacterium]|jgi:uncharacterized damage-inducible protein DinB